MEFIRFPQIPALMRKDLVRFSPVNEKKFIQDNAFGYYVCSNTWLNLAYSHSSKVADILSDCILAYGLVDTIARCDHDASSILQYLNGGEDTVISDMCRFICSNVNIHDCLQILRFPKRFTPYGETILQDQAELDFIQLNNSVKLRSRREDNQWLIKELRSIVSDILQGYDPNKIEDNGYFSSGSVADEEATTCLVDKVKCWDYPYYLDIRYPMHARSFPNYDPIIEYDRDHNSVYPLSLNSDNGVYKDELRVATGLAVPKSYKVGRLIAKERSTRQWLMQGMRAEIQRCITANGYGGAMKFEDQSHNQLLSFLGSRMDICATIDLTGASDHCRMSLVEDIFPDSIMHDYRELRSFFVDVHGKRYVAHMAATSGSAMCFVIETIVFYSIALLATRLVNRFCGIQLDESLVSSYGDDIIVPCEAYETCCDLLEIFGFVVNKEKSYNSPSRYRESCGVEFLDGHEMTIKYWPRKPIRKDIASLPSLISIHNKFVEVWEVHTFLKSVIREIAGPKFTTTQISSYVDDGDVTDLLDPVTSETQKILAPYSTKELSERYAYNAHMVVIDVPFGRGAERKPCNDVYEYVEFLRHGPYYESPLDELLRVSSPRFGRDMAYAKRTSKLVLQPDI